MADNPPEEGKYVELKYERNGVQETVQGEVSDVDTDPIPEDIEYNFIVRDNSGERNLVYHELTDGGSILTVQNRQITLSDDVSWRYLS